MFCHCPFLLDLFKEHITGFQFEPWHYRYVGQELAQAVHESGLTYDEYIASFPTDTLPQAQYAVLAGEPVLLKRAAVSLNDTHYLTAKDLSDVLGLSCTISAEGGATLTAPGMELSVSRDVPTAQLNGGEVTLDHVPFVQNGDLFLPVEDIAAWMGLVVSQTEDRLVLTTSLEPVTEAAHS